MSYRDEVAAFVRRRGLRGATVTEVKAVMDPHHGHTSGALSLLHKAGTLSRLAERRDRCKVYVAPEYVDGRQESPHGSEREMPALLAG